MDMRRPVWERGSSDLLTIKDGSDRAGPVLPFLSDRLTAINETGSLPVSLWRTVVCHKLENQGPMAASEPFTKGMGDSATDGGLPGTAICRVIVSG